MTAPPVVVFSSVDNIILDNNERKMATYLEIGWDKKAIKQYLEKKENIMQIASFNTPTVTFSASSRRNRFYEIYDRQDMLQKDQEWEKAAEFFNKLKTKYHIVIITSRALSQKDGTLAVLKKLGFNLEGTVVLFKDQHESLAIFKSNCVAQVKERYPIGYGVCLTPNDAVSFDRVGYTTIGFTSLKNDSDFSEVTDSICKDWKGLFKLLSNAELPTEAVISPSTEPNVLSLLESLQEKVSKTAQTAQYTIDKVDPLHIEKKPAEISTSETTPGVVSSPSFLKAAPLKLENLPKASTIESSESIILTHSEERIETKQQTQSMLDQAVFHQLFLGSDRIMGSTSEDSVEIPNVEELLTDFMVEIKSKLKFIMARDIGGFFTYFSQRFQMNFNDIITGIDANLASLDPSEAQGFTIVYMVLAKFIESIREKAFESWGKARIKQIYERIRKEEYGGEFSEKIEMLIQNNNSNMVLLSNLSFIAWLATVFPENPVSAQISEVIAFPIQKIVIQLFKN